MGGFDLKTSVEREETIAFGNRVSLKCFFLVSHEIHLWATSHDRRLPEALNARYDRLQHEFTTLLLTNDDIKISRHCSSFQLVSAEPENHLLMVCLLGFKSAMRKVCKIWSIRKLLSFQCEATIFAIIFALFSDNFVA